MNITASVRVSAEHVRDYHRRNPLCFAGPPASGRWQRPPAATDLDEVGVEVLTRLQPDTAFGERLDRAVHDRGPARLHRFEEVGVGDETQSLVPRVVRRCEMGVDVVVVAEHVLPNIEHSALKPRWS